VIYCLKICGGDLGDEKETIFIWREVTCVFFFLSFFVFFVLFCFGWFLFSFVLISFSFLLFQSGRGGEHWQQVQNERPTVQIFCS